MVLLTRFVQIVVQIVVVRIEAYGRRRQKGLKLVMNDDGDDDGDDGDDGRMHSPALIISRSGMNVVKWGNSISCTFLRISTLAF